MNETEMPVPPMRYWWETEMLQDLLLEADDLHQALSQGLDFLLSTLKRPYGAVFVTMAPTLSPTLWVNNLPNQWLGLLSDPQSPLNIQVQKTILDGKIFAGEEAGLPVLFLPLAWNEKVLGAVMMGGVAGDEEEWPDWKMLVRPVARIISIYNKHSTAINHYEELLAMKLIAAAQNTELDINQIQLQMCLGLKEIFKGTAVLLFLLDDDDPHLAIKKYLGSQDDWASQSSLKMDAGLVRQCMQTGQAVELLDTHTNHLLNRDVDCIDGVEMQSAICIPMIANGQTLGALEIINHKDAPLNAYEMGLLMSMTTALANAIQNRRLFLRLKVINGDLEASRWELLNSRNTLRTLFDSMPSSIYIVDRKYTLIAINMSRSGRAREKPNLLAGRRCYEALFNRDHPCPGCRVSETFINGKSTERIGSETVDEDRQLEWEITTFPIYQDTSTQPVQVIVLEEDVTEKQRLEANLIQSERLAAVGQLAAGVAHEINNPLAAIIANAQLLERDLANGDPDLLESIKLISLAGTRASRVVRTLLSFSRKEKLEFSSIDLNANIMNAISLLQHEIVSRPIALELDLGSYLPRLIASKDHLEGIWINLIMNAIDATEGIQCKLKISTSFQNNKYRISIADNGHGISPDHLPHIFEPFYTTKAPGRGTGLGLSVCYRTVKQHGGTIEVESKVGQGTKFTIILPISPQ